METIKFSCNVAIQNATDKPLTVALVLDGETQNTTDVTENTVLECTIPDVEDAEYNLELVISGKTDSHTQVNEDSTVATSTELVFSNFQLNETDISSIVLMHSLPYTHNNNGSTDTVTESFYDTAGCNGSVTLKFTTPLDLWLLENM